MVFGRRVVVALMGVLSSSVLTGCAGAKAKGRAKPMLGVDVEANERAILAEGKVVSGVVVHADEGWPLAGRIVEIAGKRAVTDAAGRFVIEDVERTYDAFVSDENGSWVSLYRGLSRRNPVLTHRVDNGVMMGRHAHRAALFVTVEGGAWPLDRDALLIQVRSATSKMETTRAWSDGPEAGPLYVEWDGAPELDAELVVVRRYNPSKGFAELAPGEVLQPHAMARMPLKLVADVEQRQTLKLTPLPTLRLLGKWEGRVQPKAPVEEGVYREFRWVFGKFDSVLYGVLVSSNGAFDYGINAPLLDASPLSEPRSLCLRVHDMKSFSQRCGVVAGQPVALGLDDVPVLLSPAITREAEKASQRKRERAFGAPLTDQAEFSWQAAPGVNRLRVMANDPSRATPGFDVYTTQNHVAASDFVHGARLSRSEAEYAVSVLHFAPFRDLDAAMSADGLASRAPRELRWSMSAEVPVLTQPAPPAGAVMPNVQVPPGMVSERAVPWAPCQHPIGSEISCGSGSWYSLTAINNRLRHYPELAFGTRIHCVTDCASAKAFMQADRDFSRAHPGYGASEPLDLPMPDPEPPPPLSDAELEDMRKAARGTKPAKVKAKGPPLSSAPLNPKAQKR